MIPILEGPESSRENKARTKQARFIPGKEPTWFAATKRRVRARGLQETTEIASVVGPVPSPGGFQTGSKADCDLALNDGKLVLPRPLPLPEKSPVRVTIESDLEREAWLKLSQESLNKVWDNEADDVFNELLKK